MTSIKVETEYGYTLLSGVTLVMTYMLHARFVVVRQKIKSYPPEFMDQFKEQHEAVLPSKVGDIGNPDSGNGLYSKKLSYKDWLMVNNAHRSHKFFLEWMPVVLLFIVIGGLQFPIGTAVAGFLFTFGRILCTIGLVHIKIKVKQAGDIIWEIALLGLFVLNILSIVYIYL